VNIPFITEIGCGPELLVENAHDVGLFHDQKLVAVDLDFGA
jgi:hypothetical protein